MSESYLPAARDADSQVWERTTYELAPDGKTVPQVHRYTELATGLNHLVGNQWVRSTEEITILPNGTAAATNGQHQVYFPADIYNGVIELVTPDGKHLKSQPTALSYDDGTHTVLIAVLTNSVGYLSSSNQVIYPNAFVGIDADLRYTYKKGGFEQDVVLREQPPTPESLGLDPNAAKLQVLTEFFNTEAPAEKQVKTRKTGLSDTILTFGKMKMVQGKAFSMGGAAKTQRSTRAKRTSVYKHWQRLQGRTFLVEEVPVSKLAAELKPLPMSASATPGLANPLLNKISSVRILQSQRLAQASTNRLQLAKISPPEDLGLVLDYNQIDSAPDGFTFLTGETYFVNGSFELDGMIVFEGGAVIKGGEMDFNDYSPEILCDTNSSMPIVFTSPNDDSIGDIIDGSSGIPSTTEGTFLSAVPGGTVLRNMRFFYSGYAIESWSARCDIWDCQFINYAYSAVIVDGDSSDNVLGLHNVLFSQGSIYGDGAIDEYSAQIIAENVTVDQAPSFVYDESQDSKLFFTNCLVTTSYFVPGGGLFMTNKVVYLPSPTTPIYQAAGSGNYYLASSSPYRGIGTTNIDPNLLAELKRMTTYAPQDGGWPDTNGTDIGYHYPINEDSDFDGLPDWWEWYWFGTYTNTGSQLDADGNSLLYDYQNNLDPNIISFTVRLGNQHFNTTNASGSYLVLGGIPSYEAVMVNNLDDTFSNAVWQPYDDTVHMNLGATDGVYQVSIGLKGIATNATPTWIGTTVYVDRTPPTVTITKPTNTLTAVPYVQIQGFAAESLQCVTYSISNAAGVLTNLPGQLIGADVSSDTNVTENFQCYDVLLTNGLNTVGISTTDLAGNVTATNLHLTLDYSAATNPVVQLTWPQNNSQICQSSFTLRGWVNDSTASVLAQITDTNNDTNVVNGLVERTGVFWVKNLPLNTGTNHVTLWVTNAAGWGSVTNFNVIQSDVAFALTGVSGDLWYPTVSVSGTIADTSAPVWVNGVQGTNNGDGTWQADNVPVSASGVASFDARVGTAGSSSPPDLTAPGFNLTEDKPDEVVTTSATWGNSSISFMGSLPNEGWEIAHGDGNYTAKNGGDFKLVINGEYPDGTAGGTLTFDTPYAPGDTSGFNMEEGSLSASSPHGMVRYQERHAKVERVFYMGGTGSNGEKVLVEADTTANEELAVWPYGRGIDLGNLIDGQVGQQGQYGVAYSAAAAGSPVKITPDGGVPMLNFNDGAAKHVLKHITACTARDNPDDTRTTIGIGELVGIYFDPELSMPVPEMPFWSVSGDGVINSTLGSSTILRANKTSNDTSADVKVEVRNVSLDVLFTILKPSSMIVIGQEDLPLGYETASGTLMGAAMYYTNVIQPSTVSFANITFGEELDTSGIDLKWPSEDMTHSSIQRTEMSRVDCDNIFGPDHIAVPLYPTNYLYGVSGTANFTWANTWHDRYKDDAGDWINFCPINVSVKYFGSNFKCQITYQGFSGNPQGPY